MRFMKGRGLNSMTLRDLLEGSYTGEYNGAGDWKLDQGLSAQTTKVFYNPNGHVVVAHRGTEGTASDWGNNLKYGSTGEIGYKQTQRFKDAKAVQKAAEERYGANRITTIGHSQGGLQAQLLGKDSHEIITVNKATTPWSDGTPAKNQYDVRSSIDAVSMWKNPFKKERRNDTTIKAKTNNPLTEHSYDILTRLPEETIIGDPNFFKENVKGKGLSDHSKKQAKRIGVTIRPSKKKGKKIDVYDDGKLVASVGASGYMDYASYLAKEGKEEADKRRNMYKKRHEKNRHKKGTPSYYADQLLW